MRRFMIAATVLALAGGLAAQQQVSVHQAVSPKFAGSYVAATGEFLPAGHTRSGPDVLFNNMIATNYYSVPGAMQEWIDEGGLLDRNACDLDQINGFDFIYCSSDPSATGTIGITFYDDNIRCAGPTTWPNANCGYAISGLPMGTTSGALQCWIVFVDLEGGFECPSTIGTTFRTEGASALLFGWGFIPFLNNTGPWIRTGGYRADNSFTWFDTTTGAFIGCFWFGGTPFASFAMKLWGNPANSIVFYANPKQAGDTINLRNTTPVQKGGAAETWKVTNPQAGATYYLIASNATNPRVLVGAGGQKFTLLIDGPPFLPPTPIVMPGGTLTAQVPANAPANVYVQAICTNGPLAQANVVGASNAICHCF